MVRRGNAAGNSYEIVPENPDAPPPLPNWAARPYWIPGAMTSAQAKFINLPLGQQRVHLYGTSLPDQWTGGPPGLMDYQMVLECFKQWLTLCTVKE